MWMYQRHEETWYISVASGIGMLSLMFIYVFLQMLAAMQGQILVIHMT
jgi:hypothetical protein